ncbi:MAG: protein-export chaperone SecB [Bacteroidales bacterium]|nr:protein-export chaperone SecB [Bacteroidales bacterium]
MKQVKSELSTFQFQGFTIERSLFERLEVKISKSLSIKIIPKGKYLKEQNKFELFLGIRIEDSNKTLKIEIDSIGIFILSGQSSDEILKSYLFLNAPAILFPYIRAYIASLTTLSGAGFPVTLPTLNLTNIGQELERNTEFI